MQEDFLHYIWKFQKYDFARAATTAGESVLIQDTGIHNELSGPDFFNSRLKIGEQLWAGNVEIHLKSSDWYLHRHESDESYDNVILHVVWEHDVEIYRADNSPIPTLELKNKVPLEVVEKYELLLSKKARWINCEDSFGKFERFETAHWLERLYFERLEAKSALVSRLLQKTENDWEAVLFQLLAKAFGLNINGESFLSIAQSFDFKIFRRNQGEILKLEAVLMGQAGFLEKECEDIYFQKLKEEYQYLQHKYKMSNAEVIKPKFFRLRPDNFPMIRLAQLAKVYAGTAFLLDRIMGAESIEDFYGIFQVELNAYWSCHYNFGKEHKPKKKRTTWAFIDLILINTIIPFQFAYFKHLGKPVETILELAEKVPAENNTIVAKFNLLKPAVALSSMESQALLQLKKNYCDLNKCLQCELGLKLLQQKTLQSP
ncbi:DUF2851 family protein [Zunongwangia sp. F363]|uniref:DUF2851 family protein n=1 Tax=Autumnicola tepida TaxID=3075595 RepID=A0ABU3C9J7_9FLAO|nr:DUF2851 family protein [Zunongwangia sp. F363]MDT0643005.1 DUF2851 family protein [Zunongwangia sp. F363]